MDPHYDDSGEIGVFDAARYFSGHEIHGAFSRKHSTVDTQSILFKAADQQSRLLILEKSDQNKITKAKKPTSSSGVRLSILLNSLFNQLNYKRNKHKQLVSSAAAATSKSSYNSSTRTNNNGFGGEVWRDRRLDGVRVVGKKWVLNNFNYEGHDCRVLLSDDRGLFENRKKNEDDDDEDSSSDSSSDLFELENCN